MTLSEELQWRGFVNQTTFANITQLDGEPMSFYFGVDPSAQSMHIGQLAMAMMIRHFIDYGHKATLLVGGATGMVGDPDGKSNERDLKSIEEIDHNKNGIAAQYKSLFAGKEFDIVDNYDWFKNMNYLDFLREVGKNVPLSQMLGRDFIQTRLGEGGSGISYAEFSYALIQGYDFLHLYRQKGITLQIAGADQWGNSVAGVELIRRIENAESHVWTAPLIINKTTGRKFGKSEEGTVWIDEDLTSAYRFYQFWLNVDDEGAIDYVKIYTLLSQNEVEVLAEKQRQNPGARDVQKTLAYEVTKLIHGEERTKSVVRVTEVLFGSADFASLNAGDLDALAAEIPVAQAGQSIVEVLVETGVATSNGEARRLIAGGAVTIGGVKVAEDTVIDSSNLVKKGKNNFVLVR
jgi:tyrosyl-tRNA synthetase